MQRLLGEAIPPRDADHLTELDEPAGNVTL